MEKDGAGRASSGCGSYTLADVHSALAYYFDHRAEVQQDLAEERRYVQQMRDETPSLLRRRLGATRGA